MTHASSPLTPTRFLARAAVVHAHRVAVRDGERVVTYAQLRDRSRRLAGALDARGLARGASVAVLATNSLEMLEAHDGVPASGRVLVPLNTRLSAPEIAYILEHAEAALLVVTADLEPLGREAVAVAAAAGHDVPVLVAGEEYEAALAAVSPAEPVEVAETDTLAINYTSGTTGRPKGVVYTHRGAYLQALAMAFHSRMTPDSVYLWTLPMFHCDGWCFTWAVTAVGATHVALPRVEADAVWTAIADHGVTHLCAAPTVLSTITSDPGAGRTAGERRVWVATGGAPPAPALLGRARACGLDVTHLYGMTETYGPIVVNEWRAEWDALPEADRDRLTARQGIANIASDGVRVIDADGRDVPADAATIGEIAVRGNNVFSHYHRDPAATAASMTADGWFRTGDLAVRHPDEYVEIRDRAKDVIISGGENISSVEVEVALMEHPDVLEAAVVAEPHEHWGERPVAFVTLRPGATTDPDDLRGEVARRLARFKVPDRVEVVELPKTATGKIRKDQLRARLREQVGDGVEQAP